MSAREVGLLIGESQSAAAGRLSLGWSGAITELVSAPGVARGERRSPRRARRGERRADLYVFASRTITSPWQGRGAHQQPTTSPRSSLMSFINCSSSSPWRSNSSMHSPARAVAPDDERVAQRAGPPDVVVVALAHAVHDARDSEIDVRWDE